jgi:hypothetical protein
VARGVSSHKTTKRTPHHLAESLQIVSSRVWPGQSPLFYIVHTHTLRARTLCSGEVCCRSIKHLGICRTCEALPAPCLSPTATRVFLRKHFKHQVRFVRCCHNCSLFVHRQDARSNASWPGRYPKIKTKTHLRVAHRSNSKLCYENSVEYLTR